jgi:glycosyltransferase involved in cell wall biosynthesis
MKLLLVVTGMPDVNGHGASAFNLDYVRALRQAGLELTIIHVRSVQPGRALLTVRLIDDVKCYSISAFLNIPFLKKVIFWGALYRRLVKRLRTDFEVVHAVGGGAAAAADISAEAARMPFILQFIGSDVNTELSKFLRMKSFKGAINRASMLCFNSAALLRKFSDQYDLSRYPTSVLRRGAPLGRLQYRFEFQGEIVLLFLGGAPKGNSKGGWTLIQAISEIATNTLSGKLIFWIAGPGAEKLKELPRASSPSIECRFLGELPRQEVLAAYANSHIVLIPSLNEGVPNVLYEAMATGNMVIASDVGGIPEVLLDGQTGILVEPNNASELAGAILKAVSNINEVRGCAERGRLRVAEYSYDRFIDSYIDLYSAVSAKTRS